MASFRNEIEKLEQQINVLKSDYQEEGQQRSPEWFEQRMGKFTGSQISELMKCSRSTAKKGWDAPEKIIDFGDGAIKYIYNKAKERQRGKVIHTPTSAAMRYGTDNEKTVVDLYMSENPDLRFEEVGFCEFISNVAGASADGRIYSGDEVYGLEVKCATTWEQFYNRTETEMNQKHMDYWQIQAEMMALGVVKLIYLVAEPSENIFEPEITHYTKKIVYQNPEAQNAIQIRANLGDKIIKKWLQNDKKPFSDVVTEVLSE